ncbi:MAG TPA: hypothetical protein VG013_26515, partial [Gemmataceae bacterium]|nr:hypothetical protein [Gemmataceae bacterium]
MGGSWAIPGGWLLHSAAGGGLLLLLAWVLVRRTRQPARRQWLGDWGVAAALLAAACSLGPAWFVVSVGLPPEEAAASASVSEPPPPTGTPRHEATRAAEVPAEPARQEPRPPTPQGEETRPEGGQGFAG